MKCKNETTGVRVGMVGLLNDRFMTPLVKMVKSADSNIKFGSYGEWEILGEDEQIPTTDGPNVEPKYNPFKPLRLKLQNAQISGVKTTDNSWSKFSLRLMFLGESVFNASYNQRLIERELNEFDVIHLQSLLSVSAIRFLLRAKKTPPIVTSLFGSEVLRNSNLRRVATHQKMLDRTDLITSTGSEFTEIALAKYGRHLRPKIRQTFFSPNSTIMNMIASIQFEDAKRQAAKTWGLSEKKTTICIGHNGFIENQHIPAIENVAKLPRSLKEDLQIVCHMSYGAKPGYLDQVRKTIKSSELSGIVMTDYLNDTEVATLRKASDILVYVPVSDAFSASVTQALTANCLTIVGSWLPYSSRRRAGFKYWEVDQLSDLPAALENMLVKLPKCRESVAGNQALGMSFFAEHRLGKMWADVYREAVGANQ